jgi:hypothetical protein
MAGDKFWRRASDNVFNDRKRRNECADCAHRRKRRGYPLDVIVVVGVIKDRIDIS